MSQIIGNPYLMQVYNPLIPYDKLVDPDISKSSYIISILPRVRALNEIYKSVKPNGNYIFDSYWFGVNGAQKEMIGFIGRKARVFPEYNAIFTPNFGLFPNMDAVTDYLREMKMSISRLPSSGNALVIMSSLNFLFPKTAESVVMRTATSGNLVRAIHFSNVSKGFKVLQSETTKQSRIFQFPTKDPRVFLNIMQTYEPEVTSTSSVQPVYDFLRYRYVRQFYKDVTWQYKSLTIPELNVSLRENTNDLDGMYLMRVNYKTYITSAIKVKNFIQQTTLRVSVGGFEVNSSVSVKEPFYQEIVNPGDYKLNTSFMIWAEHLDINMAPLFIGYINENNFVLIK